MSIDFNDLMEQQKQSRAGLRALLLPCAVEAVVLLVASLLFFGWPQRFAADMGLMGGLLALVFGGGVCWPFVDILSRHLTEGAEELKARQPTQAVVKDASLEPFTTRNGTLYSPIVRYSYTVGGQTYKQSREISTSRHNLMFIHARTLRRFRPGCSITVYIDPQNPESSVLKPSTSVGHHIKSLVLYVPLLLFGGVAIVGLLGILAAVIGLVF